MAKRLLQQHPQSNGQGLPVPSAASPAFLPSCLPGVGRGFLGSNEGGSQKKRD